MPESTNSVAAGLGTRVVRFTLLMVWLLGIASLLIRGAPPGSAAILTASSLLSVLAIWLVTTPGVHSLSGATALLAAAASFCSGAAALLVMSPEEELWQFNFPTYLLALLIARGNVREGLVGGLLLVLTGLSVGISQDVGFAELAEFLALPIVALVSGSLWRVALVNMINRERRRTIEIETAHLEATATEAAIASAREVLAQVRTEAEPVLLTIRDAARLDDVTATEIAIVESSIRDQMRSPLLRHPLINESVLRARRQGVSVLLLGTESSHRALPADPLAVAVATIITATREGTVTVRAMPQGRDAAISVLVEDGGPPQRSILDEEGALIERR